MKKTLIALATLAAAGTAFAQSSVTISGIVDLSVATVGGDGQTLAQKGTFVNASRGSATSGINFNIVEDLGGGLRAQGFYGIDPRAIINDPAANFGRHEAYVGLSGGFGNIRLGSINTASLAVLGAGGPFGTATGSGFAEIHAAGGGNVRFANSVRYDAPTFIKGLSANVTYAPGNKDALAAALPTATDLGLAYTTGPLQVSFSSLSRSAITAPAAPLSTKSTVDSIAANYRFGALRVMGGFAKGNNSSVGTGLDTETTRIGATYTMGAIALHAQQATLKIGNAPKRTATGLRADYALSKRTTTYVGYEAYDQGSPISVGFRNERTTAMVGVRHSF